MATFKNLDDLFKAIKKDIQDSMSEVGETVQEEVKTQLDVDVYSHDPNYYERTYELKESVVYSRPQKDGDKITTQVFHDTDSIGSYSPNQHYSVYKSKGGYSRDVSDFIPEWVHEGKSSHVFGTGFWTTRRPYMDNAYDNLKSSNEHVDTLKDELKRKGYDFK